MKLFRRTSLALTAAVGAAAIAASASLVRAAPILSVDFNGTTGDSMAPLGATQSGFTGITSSSATVGSYTISETTTFTTGYYSRAGVSNIGSFTEANLYEDFFYAQKVSNDNPTATISISAPGVIVPGNQYTIVFYTYDASGSIGTTAPHTTSFVGASNTTLISGTDTSSYTAGAPLTANEQYTATGVFTTTTSELDILASITSNNGFLRINGFTVSVPEPACIPLIGLSITALLRRRRTR
jgi:hypothetical protein